MWSATYFLGCVSTADGHYHYQDDARHHGERQHFGGKDELRDPVFHVCHFHHPEGFFQSAFLFDLLLFLLSICNKK
jgi:hypothetical protein